MNTTHSLRAALATVALSLVSVATAQVNTPGSRDERETDARALSAERAEKPATPADQALLNTQSRTVAWWAPRLR
mgnify:CR=1 FL=1